MEQNPVPAVSNELLRNRPLFALMQRAAINKAPWKHRIES